LQTTKLVQARFRHARLYWNMLKQSAGMKTPNINIDILYNYFTSVNNPEDWFFLTYEDVLYFVDIYERSEFTIIFNELDLPFSQDCLTKAIQQLGLNKCNGPDLYLNEFFMYGKDV